MSDTPVPRRQTRCLILLLEYVLVFGVTVATLSPHRHGEVGAHIDTVHHLLAAEDCLTGDACHLRLSPRGGTSILGLFHGAAFVHILVFVQWLGGDLGSIHLTFALLSGLATVLLYALIRRESGPLPSLAMAVVFVSMVAREHMTLWNPTLSPLPAVLFLALALEFLRDRRFNLLLLASAVAGVAFQVHLAAGALFVPLAVLVGLLPRGMRLSGALIAVTVVVGTIQVVSPAMVIDADWSVLTGHPARWPVLLLGMLGLGGWVTFIVRRARERSPLAWLLAGAYAPLIAVAVVVAPHEGRYLLPVAPGGLLLAGRALSGLGVRVRRLWSERRTTRPGWWGWIALGAVACGAFYTVLNPLLKWHSEGLSLVACERIAGHLRTDPTLTYEDVRRRLRGGSAASEVLGGLGLYLPMTTGPRAVSPAAGVGPGLAVFRIAREPRGLPPETWTYLPGGEGEGVLIQQLAGWLALAEAETCTSSTGDARLELEALRGPLPPGLQPLRAQRDYPLVREIVFPDRFPARLVARIPVRIPAHAGERVVVVPPGAYGPRLPCDGLIEDVEGVVYEGALPSNRILLSSSDTPQEGALLVRWEFDGRTCSPFVGFPERLPPVNEFRGEEMNVLEAVLPRWEVGVEPMPPTGGSRLKLSDLTRVEPARGVPWYDDRPEPTVPRAYVIGLSLVLACGSIAATGALLWILSRDQADAT